MVTYRIMLEIEHQYWGLGPDHPGDLPKGTLDAILKQLGVNRDEFDAA